MTVITAPAPATSGRLVAADGKTLPLRSSQLTTTAGNGLARTRLVQRFANPHREPLSVNYQLPLPADGAVAGFAFTVGDRRVEGEIEGRKAARERFEEAVAQGHTAALLEQDRTALFQQAIGNIPPGAEVVAEILVEQPLLWIDGVWEFRFPTTVAPRYLGAEGRVPDAARIEVDVAGAPLPPRLELELRVEDLLAPGSEVASPSHGLQGEFAGGTRTVRFAAGPVRLDRDLVVRWNVGTPEVGTSLATARPGAGAPHGDVAYGLLTLVPPAGPTVAVPRDLTVLIDTSGSMGGRPLDQAKAVVKELVAGLGDQDQLQMIEFSDAPRRWQPGPVRATAATRRKAQQWLAGLTASGGTEMLSGVRESLCSLREEAQAQVLLVTDGLVGFEQQIVSALRNGLPRNCRFHVLGVGSATNRSLSYAAARAGRGVEAIVCLDEDPAEGARRLGAAMRTPVVVDLELSP
ncbi:MAG: VWA domain-containing protein, partial [Planctomycetes bacterium]|nr:VWA domain-containing protein [Planctomycetota bacterium]